jgi:glycosyltransferase involved in cell wall biosynthesis
MAALPPISVCLIVKNEADRVAASIAPFIGRVPEILVYDNGSTDGTQEILKKMGVTVLEGPWMGFAKTRKALWKLARQPWILWLDADEIFHEDTIRALSIVGSMNGVGGYSVCRQVVFEGRRIRHGDWFPDWVLRVFRRDNFEMADRLVHESVEVKGAVFPLPGVVEHHSFRNWADLENRSRNYALLWARQAVFEGKKPCAAWPHAFWNFFRGFFIKSGWLDGSLGYRIALHNAREVYSKYKLLQELSRNKGGKPLVGSV